METKKEYSAYGERPGELTMETYVYDQTGYEWFVITSRFGKMLKTLAVLGSRDTKGKYDFSLNTEVTALNQRDDNHNTMKNNELIEKMHEEGLQLLSKRHKLITE